MKRQKLSKIRFESLDALRGLIMLLMALDHANYFVAQQHSTGEHWGGPFPVYTSALPFLIRVVTHPVAPGFSFLMGIGMVLFAHSRKERGWELSRIRSHFIFRGLLLIALQFVIVNPAWKISSLSFPRIYQGVLVALGGGMILATLFINWRCRSTSSRSVGR